MWLLAGAGASAVLAIVVIALVVPRGAPPTALDRWVFDTTSGWTAQAPWATQAAAVIGAATDVVPSSLLAVAVTIALLVARRAAFALFVAGSAAVGALVAEVLKLSIGRQRPPGAAQYVQDLDRSFPSGHASAGIYLYAALAVLLILVARRRGSRPLLWSGRALFVCGAALGLTRIVLGVHWATDVMAGWANTSVVLLLAAYFVRPDDAALGAGPPGGPPTDAALPADAGTEP